MDNKELKEEILEAFLIALDEGKAAEFLKKVAKGTRNVAAAGALAGCAATDSCEKPLTLSNADRAAKPAVTRTAPVTLSNAQRRAKPARTGTAQELEDLNTRTKKAGGDYLNAVDRALGGSVNSRAQARAKKRESSVEQIRNAVSNYLKEESVSSQKAKWARRDRRMRKRHGDDVITSAGDSSAEQAEARRVQAHAEKRFGDKAWAQAGLDAAKQAETLRKQRQRDKRFKSSQREK